MEVLDLKGKNSLFDLIYHQPNIDKLNLRAKYPHRIKEFI